MVVGSRRVFGKPSVYEHLGVWRLILEFPAIAITAALASASSLVKSAGKGCLVVDSSTFGFAVSNGMPSHPIISIRLGDVDANTTVLFVVPPLYVIDDLFQNFLGSLRCVYCDNYLDITREPQFYLQAPGVILEH